MLIPSFCSIARKGIRELDTTEKENHHGEKDYAFFHAVPFPTPPLVCAETSAREEFSDRNEAIKGIFRVGFRSGTKALVTIATSGRKKRRQLY